MPKSNTVAEVAEREMPADDAATLRREDAQRQEEQKDRAGDVDPETLLRMLRQMVPPEARGLMPRRGRPPPPGSGTSSY